MNFEELKIIWDSQSREPLYAINEAALHDLVRHRRDEEHRRTACRHGLSTGGIPVTFDQLVNPPEKPELTYLGSQSAVDAGALPAQSISVPGVRAPKVYGVRRRFGLLLGRAAMGKCQ